MRKTTKKISSLSNLRQYRGKSRRELEAIATASEARKNDSRLRRLLLIAGLDPWLRSFESHYLPRSLFVQLLEDGPDKLAKESLKFLNDLAPLQRDKYLTELVDDENDRLTSDAQKAAIRKARRKGSAVG